jgi:hypothetical protein
MSAQIGFELKKIEDFTDLVRATLLSYLRIKIPVDVNNFVFQILHTKLVQIGIEHTVAENVGSTIVNEWSNECVGLNILAPEVLDSLEGHIQKYIILTASPPRHK